MARPRRAYPRLVFFSRVTLTWLSRLARLHRDTQLLSGRTRPHVFPVVCVWCDLWTLTRRVDPLALWIRWSGSPPRSLTPHAYWQWTRAPARAAARPPWSRMAVRHPRVCGLRPSVRLPAALGDTHGLVKNFVTAITNFCQVELHTPTRV